MYSIGQYGAMISGSARMSAYVNALREAVHPDSVVLDIGTGTGIFALLACQFGARRVYAIEPDNAIHVAQDIAQANGYEKRIEFIQKLSTEVTLPESVDVIIADLRGRLPLFQDHIPVIIDARQRFLVPGGQLIPQLDTLWAAVSAAPDAYHDEITPFQDNVYNLDMQPALRFVTDTFHRGLVTPEQLLVEPTSWGTLDYATIESPNLSANLTWTVTRAGTAQGLIAWFDTTTVNGAGFSNAPGQPPLIYNRAFVPWSEPVSLTPGDTVCVTLQANLIDGDYVWRWNTRITDQGNPEHIKANFKQSTFLNQPTSPTQLHKKSDRYVPTLSHEGQIDQFILTLMDGDTSLGDIARQVSERFPATFTTWQSALTKVSELSKQYSDDDT